ncbi:MAG TPA: PIN domain-containing protein [Thermodesulfobacteriota bacterium]|nr:PIN domain-containing protein [Thermodesulfobacteriota bacterium]
MTLSRLEEFLKGHGLIGLDTSVFIYQVEENPKYIELVNPVFVWLEGSRAHAVTSTITMLELLVHPYRLSDIDRVNRFYALLSTYPHLEWVPPTLEIADVAARLRAEHNLRTPDAIQAATALTCHATGFISNDIAFQRVADLEVLILDELLITEMKE